MLNRAESRPLSLTGKMSLTVTCVFNRGPLLELFWMDHRLLFQWPQKMPISPGPIIVHQLHCMLYRWRCPDPSPDPLVVVYKIPAWDRMALKLFAQGHQGSKTTGWSLVFWRWSKSKNNKKKKNFFELPYPPQSTAFHSNSCWYLLFLWW